VETNNAEPFITIGPRAASRAAGNRSSGSAASNTLNDIQPTFSATRMRGVS
jgi:hypothetical protein